MFYVEIRKESCENADIPQGGIVKIWIEKLEDDYLIIGWECLKEAQEYRIDWADRYQPTTRMQEMARTDLRDRGEGRYTLQKATHIPHYLRVRAFAQGQEIGRTEVLKTPVKKRFHVQREKLGRGLAAVMTQEGVFVSWRLFRSEAKGWSDSGLTGTDFVLYRDGRQIAVVSDSTNYLDREGTPESRYQIAPHTEGWTGELSEPVKAWPGGQNYLEIPLAKPADGITRPGVMHPEGEAFTYSANDMSVGDVDGDGEFEYFVKWDPSNSHDVSHRGYTGSCLIDCYKLILPGTSGDEAGKTAESRLLWRLDMGPNIRAGAHYTQFMVFDFDGDGRAEMCVKTAPGTKMTVFDEQGSVASERFITLLPEDAAAGVTNSDDYVCSADGYRRHMADVFLHWHEHPQVTAGHWPAWPEECFGPDAPACTHPLSQKDADTLADYFIRVYAPSRSEKNRLGEFEGFIFSGPEYLTMFSGDGRELQTIAFPVPREDDGLIWGDYCLSRIEPCNRVDRFLSAVAYLDGEHPSVIIGRGYYTRTTITALDFREGRFSQRFTADSGHVLMMNPFGEPTQKQKDEALFDGTALPAATGALLYANPHLGMGTSPTHGRLAGQGNHSLSVADVDGDGCQEVICGAAVIDHDGSLLYSSYGKLPDGTPAKFGHGDSMHVADIDPDKPGLEIFNVFEGAKAAPWGYALRDAGTGEVIFGAPADTDLGRCMVGDIDPKTRGLQCWVNDTFDCQGNRLDVPTLGTNASIRWAADLSTQIIDGADYLHGEHKGSVVDNTHGIMLMPRDTLTNNGTKGNPCLIADLFGDFREELILRTVDSQAIRIYMNTEITGHKLFTLLDDVQYRVGVAWQNNCYNQPCYPGFYYGRDMDFAQVIPGLPGAGGEGDDVDETEVCGLSE